MAAQFSPVPNLTTAARGPLLHIERRMLDRQAAIETWFRGQWRENAAPFYASVDLRNAGYKIAPVDTNLFPAGFNNLSPAFMPLCIQALQAAVERLPADVSRVLIVPESHTRNLFYLESLAVLRTVTEKAGFDVRIGSLIADLKAPQTVELPSGRSVLLEPLQREGNRLRVADFDPDLVLLNNDLSGGMPSLLEGIEQRIVPPTALGWHQRLKSVHFRHYQAVAEEFGRHIDLDPWCFDPLFRNCGEVNFMEGSGMNCLRKHTGELLEDIRKKYAEYGISCRPFVIVKADAGTYGMGVMTVYDAEEVMTLNRKERTRMSTAKEGVAIRNIIVQEGVYTHETWGEPPAVAEPVVYMIDRHVVGGFYRVNTARAIDQNLNTPGMRFEPLAFADCCISPERQLSGEAHLNRFYAYGVVARLALVAAAREMRAVQHTPTSIPAARSA